MAVSIALLLWNLRGKDLAHARGETVSLSHILAEQTTRSIQNVDLALQNTRVVLAEFAAQGEPLTRYAVHSLLHDRLSGIPQIKGIFVVDVSGHVLSTSRVFPAEGISIADREYFTAQRDDPQRGLYIGAPTHNRVDGIWTMYLSRRVNGRGGEFAGVIAVALNLGYFEDLYRSISFDGIDPISLYLGDGTLVARQPHDEAAIGKRLPEAPANSFGGADQSTREETEAGGGVRIVTYHQVAQFPLMVSVAISKDEALASWVEKSRLLILGTFGVSLLVMLAAWALVRELEKEDTLAMDLLESGERLQETMKAAMDAIIIADAGQRVILFNPAAERMFGCAVTEAIGARLERFLPERHRAGHRRHVEDFGASAGGSRVMAASREVTGLRADGTEFPIEATVSRVTLNGEILYTVILRDVTERRQADQQLLESNRQLRELSATLQDVREKERTRIARELHDELGQQLTGLKMELSWLGNQLDERPDGLAHKVDGMKQQVDMTIKSVRRISTELRPTLLDDLGLGAAIEWLAADFGAKTGIVVELDLAAADSAQGDALATALFRITQECLTNVARHAAATQVNISLRRDGDVLELIVADNGKGMAGGTSRGGHGLIGIRERAIMLGAKATFVSSPGAGTAVKVAIPLAQQPTTDLET
ncbi:MAG: PAS domain S-box protein [Rhodocyclaceae bacterium]|nr:PAS domain S-box protein [Rhodocyclaceae bacterium]